MRTPFKPSQERGEHTAGTWNTAPPTPHPLTSLPISPTIIARLWLHLLSVLHQPISPPLHNPRAGSMTGCWARVIRAGWYRQRTQRPLMLMFSPPGRIFLAHLEWERTSINMATWQGVGEAAARSDPGPQSASFLFFFFYIYILLSREVACCWSTQDN